MFGFGMWEMVVIGMVAILLFGKRLPNVAKSLGSSYRQFKQGLADIQSTVDFDSMDSKPQTSYASSSTSSSSSYDDYDDYDEATAPKFEPPPSEPKVESSESA